MSMKVCAILLAAGRSTRMGVDENGRPINKLTLNICGRTPIRLCLNAFIPYVDEIVIAASDNTLKAADNAVRELGDVGIPIIFSRGGSRRQDSVYNAIRATKADIVAIHDCARCLVTGDIIERSINSAIRYGSGVASIPSRDTMRVAKTGSPVARENYIIAQTPQCFDRGMLLKAYENCDVNVTDDAAIWSGAYGQPRYTEGNICNQKLTDKSDVAFFNNVVAGRCVMQVGLGEDTHRLTSERRLILGGVAIPYHMGLLGHSDADVLVHAIIDALLGACAMGDIGTLFPDNDAAYKDISSLRLLSEVSRRLYSFGYCIVNIDAVITAQEPKLAPYIMQMRKNIADTLNGIDKHIGFSSISVKATTPEGMGAEGRLECITCRAVAMCSRNV